MVGHCRADRAHIVHHRRRYHTDRPFRWIQTSCKRLVDIFRQSNAYAPPKHHIEALLPRHLTGALLCHSIPSCSLLQHRADFPQPHIDNYLPCAYFLSFHIPLFILSLCFQVLSSAKPIVTDPRPFPHVRPFMALPQSLDHIDI